MKPILATIMGRALTLSARLHAHAQMDTTETLVRMASILSIGLVSIYMIIAVVCLSVCVAISAEMVGRDTLPT